MSAPTSGPARDPRTTGSASRTRSGFEHLGPEVQAEAYRRLAGAALIYVATFALVFGLQWMRLLRQQQVFCAPSAADVVRATLAMGVGAYVWWIARGRRIPPHRFLGKALLFEVFATYGIVGDLWNWPHVIARYLHALESSGTDLAALRGMGVWLFGNGNAGDITWASIWILLFPLLVPMPRRQAILASFLSTSVLPAVIVAAHLWHGVDDVVVPYLPVLYASTLGPAYVIAGIAAYASSVTFRLSRDLTKARELGAYRLVELLGRGGMGEVWRASHRMLARPAAVKLIRPEALGDGRGGAETARRRFEREAQATAALASPHTIELYDFGVAEDGTFYYVMELLDGVDLRTLVERWGPQPAARTVAILRQACHSLADAHATGLVHRDVKPANLFLCRRGLDHDFVKVLDFGLVKDAAADRDDGTQLTVEGVASGTPAFMAPEMVAGGEIDGRADLYALGCVAYWLLTGGLVFEGPTAMATLLAHARDVPEPPSRRTELEVPADLEALVMELLEKDPDRRPADALEVRRRLAELEVRLDPWTPERAHRWWTTHRPESRPAADAADDAATAPPPDRESLLRTAALPAGDGA